MEKNKIQENVTDVKIIIVLSGKRKSGKDYVADGIVTRLSENKCQIIRVATPIKKHFSQKYNMNYREMMTASEYKEQRREEMILWGEAERAKDLYVFCKAAAEEARNSQKPVWILSDARRPTDVDYFRRYANEHNSRFFAIRVTASIETRKTRGWKFTKGVDDVDSECALDEYNEWNHVFENSSTDNIANTLDNFCRHALHQFLNSSIPINFVLTN